MKYIIRERQHARSDFNAGSKARNDVDQILSRLEFEELPIDLELTSSKDSPLKKIKMNFERYASWRACGNRLVKGDTVVFQYPVRNHTIFLGNILKQLNQRGVITIGVIHDLESLRQVIDPHTRAISKVRFSLEEVSALKYFTKIIVHNEQMKQTIHEMFHVPTEKMVSLEIFDYLFEPLDENVHAIQNGPVVIAGNLDPQKAGYVYSLPQGVSFELFGANLDENFTFRSNVKYRGKVKPDVLPSVLYGSYGLVWDGCSAETCEGVYGAYLKINNPHKTSLYLASGLPVIVWKQSAMAAFVKKYNCGLAVDSLQEIGAYLSKQTPKEYALLAKNAIEVGVKLRKGYFMTNAISN